MPEYFSSNSPDLNAHFTEYADWIKTRLKLPAGSVHMDVGCNDGLLLQKTQSVGYSPLGIGMVDLKSILETMEQANPKANIMHELDGSRNMPYTARQTAEISKWYLQKLGYMTS